MSRDERTALVECIDLFYAAAAGTGDWAEAGRLLCTIFSAGTATLKLADQREMFAVPEEAQAAYAAHFHAVDPFRMVARRHFATERADHLLRARTGDWLVGDDVLLASEYYNDFGRRFGRRHVLGGMIGGGQATPIGLHRPHGMDPFTSDDSRRLEFLLPHIQRAVDIHEKLTAQAQSQRLALGMLDALPARIVLVDGGARVRFANAAALEALARPGSGLALLHSGPRPDSGTYLAARHRQDAIALRRLVASAAGGGPGGALRIQPRDEADGDPPRLTALVSPAPPAMLAEAGAPPAAEGRLVLVVIEDLARRAAPSEAMMCDLFGLSRSEAEVAVRLVGGASAEDVAAGRGVSLDTVRNQIRAILRKSEASNLRDLERVMAMLSAAAPVAEDTARRLRRPAAIDLA